MRTAEEILREIYQVEEDGYLQLEITLNPDFLILREAINRARKEAIEECAERAQIIRQPTGEGQSSETYISSDFEGDLGYEDYIPVTYSIYKESILSLIKEIE